jgi:hypothetical protein
MGQQAGADSARTEDRRHRRTMTAVTGALVLLVAIPFVRWSTQGGEPVGTPATSSTTATTQASPSPSRTSATIPSVAPTGDADAPARMVTVDPAVPLVARPGLPHLLDTTLHRGSTTRTFPVKPVFEYIPLAEGRALLLDEFHGYEWDRLQLLDKDGRILLSSVAPSEHFVWAVANGAGTRFAVLDTPDAGSSDGVLTLRDSDGTEQLRRTGVLDRLSPVGIVGDRVFLRSRDAKGGSYAWDLRDNMVRPYADWEVGSVNEASGRAAFTGPTEWDAPRCTLVADVRGPRPLPVSTTCGHFQSMQFSPDGRYLLGIAVAPNDPPFLGAPKVIDTDAGRPVLSFEEPTDMVTWTAFLADGSVGLNLLLHPHLDDAAIHGLTEAPAWSSTLVRCTVDGACTRMAETIPAGSGDEGPRPRYQLVRD